jgi:isoleucyl-tRNA synthetase
VGDKVTAKEFRQHCREFALGHVENQKADFQRLGVLGDWDNPYLTMDFQQEADIIRSLGNIAANGHLHKGLKPVHWCMDCGSALAEAEVEYEEKQSHAVDVAFAVKDWLILLNVQAYQAVPSAVDFVIWTTTPWTLPANQAVSLHPELVYVVVQADIAGQTRILVLAQALYEATLARYQAENIQVLAEVAGASL